MKHKLLPWITALAVFSAHANDGLPSQDENQEFSGSSTAAPGYQLTIDEKRLVVKKSSDPDGNILLISNSSGFGIRVHDNQNLDVLVDPDSSLSWGCSQDDYVASYILETTSGTVIESLYLNCGDVLYVIQEDLGS